VCPSDFPATEASALTTVPTSRPSSVTAMTSTSLPAFFRQRLVGRGRERLARQTVERVGPRVRMNSLV